MTTDASLNTTLAVFFGLFLSTQFTPFAAPLGLLAIRGALPIGAFVVANGVYAVLKSALDAVPVAVLVESVTGERYPRTTTHDRITAYTALSLVCAQFLFLGVVQIAVGAVKIARFKKSRAAFRTPQLFI